MIPLRSRWPALGLLVLALVLLAAALLLCWSNGLLVTQIWLTTAFFLFTPIGVLIAVRRPQQLIGRLFCAIGLLYSLWSLQDYKKQSQTPA